jgi:hypothetical protein
MKNSALLPSIPLLLLAIAGCDGSENNVNQLFPEILVSPTEVDFGEVVKDYPATVALEIINGGRAPLKISSIVLRGDGVVPYAVDITEAEIGWNNTEEDPTADREVVNLTFLPPNYFTYDAELVINSNDPNYPEWVVPVTGIGSDGPTPDIELEPMSLDYGDVTPGTISTKWVTIKNAGDGDLVINSTAQTGSGDFSIATDPRGQTIVAGGSVQMIVLYSPNIPDVEGEEIGDDGVITLTTNDPDESTVEIQLVGNGGSTFEYPIADIDCPGVGAPPETIVLDGSGSVDPMGYALIDYNWYFPNGEDDDCPDGSTCTLQASAGTSSELYMDIAGGVRGQPSGHQRDRRQVRPRRAASSTPSPKTRSTSSCSGTRPGPTSTCTCRTRRTCRSLTRRMTWPTATRTPSGATAAPRSTTRA